MVQQPSSSVRWQAHKKSTLESTWLRFLPITAKEWKLSKKTACNGMKNFNRSGLNRSWCTESNGNSRNAKKRRLNSRGPCKKCSKCSMPRENRLSKSNRRPINWKSREKKTDNSLVSYLKRTMRLNSMSTTRRIPNQKKFSHFQRQVWQNHQLELQYLEVLWKRISKIISKRLQSITICTHQIFWEQFTCQMISRLRWDKRLIPCISKFKIRDFTMREFWWIWEITNQLTKSTNVNASFK